MTRSTWLAQLERWLAEVACDSVAAYLYGEARLAALNTILEAYAVPVASSSHPQPSVRIAIQRANNASELEQYRPPGDPFASPETCATAALIELAIPLREQVRNELAGRIGTMEMTDEIARTVEPSGCGPNWSRSDVTWRARRPTRCAWRRSTY
jgi:hypothetical protein